MSGSAGKARPRRQAVTGDRDDPGAERGEGRAPVRRRSTGHGDVSKRLNGAEVDERTAEEKGRLETLVSQANTVATGRRWPQTSGFAASFASNDEKAAAAAATARDMGARQSGRREPQPGLPGCGIQRLARGATKSIRFSAVWQARLGQHFTSLQAEEMGWRESLWSAERSSWARQGTLGCMEGKKAPHLSIPLLSSSIPTHLPSATCHHFAGVVFRTVRRPPDDRSTRTCQYPRRSGCCDDDSWDTT
jgi:hypothetical protein